jgi:hypothetical protein
MSAPVTEVAIDLGVIDTLDMRLDFGRLDTNVLSDGLAFLAGYVTSVSVQRGTSSQLVGDPAQVGTCTVVLNNEDRRFDPGNIYSPYAGFLVPGRAVVVTATPVGGLVASPALFTGIVDDWDLSYDVSGRSVAVVRAVDALGVLGRGEFDAWTTTAAQLPGARLASILDRPEVAYPTSNTSLATGVDSLQGDNVSWGSNVLNYMQLVVRGDLGYLFASRTGVLTFLDRNYPVGAVALADFDDGSFNPGNPAFSSISAQVGSESLLGRVGVDRTGGTKQTATVANPTQWAATYGGIRSLSFPATVLANDTQSLALATYILNLYSTPAYRINELVVDVVPMSFINQATMVVMELAKTVRVFFTPNRTGAIIQQTLVVQGIRHDITPGVHTMTLNLQPAPLPAFRLDSSTYGHLDNTTYRLGF